MTRQGVRLHPEGGFRRAAARQIIFHLPSPLSSLIGREQDLDEVAATLSSTRLVTLTGAQDRGPAAPSRPRHLDAADDLRLREEGQPRRGPRRPVRLEPAPDAWQGREQCVRQGRDARDRQALLVARQGGKRRRGTLRLALDGRRSGVGELDLRGCRLYFKVRKA